MSKVEMNFSKALDVLNNNYTAFDNAGDLLKRTDRRIEVGDLEAVIKNDEGKYSDEMIAAAKLILNNATAFHKLDNADGKIDNGITKQGFVSFFETHKKEQTQPPAQTPNKPNSSSSYNTNQTSTPQSPINPGMQTSPGHKPASANVPGVKDTQNQTIDPNLTTLSNELSKVSKELDQLWQKFKTASPADKQALMPILMEKTQWKSTLLQRQSETKGTSSNTQSSSSTNNQSSTSGTNKAEPTTPAAVNSSNPKDIMEGEISNVNDELKAAWDRFKDPKLSKNDKEAELRNIQELQQWKTLQTNFLTNIMKMQHENMMAVVRNIR